MGKAKVQQVHTFPYEHISEKRWKPSSPLVPMNQKQANYIDAIESSPCTVATGYAGTSKTYIPVRLASKWLQQKAIDAIYMVRPAVSMSKSLGFFKGDVNEKMRQWINPIMSTLQEEFPYSSIEYFLKPEIGKIVAKPLETIKGESFKNCFVLIDEAEDLSIHEVIALLTRIGTNCTMVFAGDIKQTDLKQTSGLAKLLELRETSEYLNSSIAHIDFDNIDTDCVRSEVCKNILKGLAETGYQP